MLFRKLLNKAAAKEIKKDKLMMNYDSFNQEASSILSPALFHGLKCEITKMVTPWLQISGIKKIGHDRNASQLFTTLSLPFGGLWQLSFDTNRSYQAKCTFGNKSWLGKIHSIVSPTDGIYTHLEGIYRSTLSTAAVKVIKPVFDLSNLIYIVNYWRAVGRVGCGVEAVSVNGRIGLGIAARVENKNGVVSASLQRFNTLIISAYRRLTRSVSIGIEGKRSNEEHGLAAGVRFSNCKSDVKLTVNNELQLGLIWEEMLSTSLSVSFTGIYDQDIFRYGISMTYDG